MDERRPMAFLSYAHFADNFDNGYLTQFSLRLSGETCLQWGDEFSIFQDRKDILWGDCWKERINSSLDTTTFLIPIITPGFFKSEYCREELSRFLDRERKLGRDDLILPVYYIDTPVLNDKTLQANDELARIIASRQYADWRNLRFEDLNSKDARKAMSNLAAQICRALRRRDHVQSTETDSNPSDKRPIEHIEDYNNEAKLNKIVFDQMYHGDASALDDKKLRANEQAQKIPLRSYEDFINLRIDDLNSEDARKAIFNLATQISRTLSRIDNTQNIETNSNPSDKRPIESIGEGQDSTGPKALVVDQTNRGDYTTINAAIAAAVPGSRILIRPGVYAEGLIIDKPLEIVGDGKIGDVSICASGKHAILFKTVKGKLSNLLIRQNGGGNWYAVYICQGCLELSGCDIKCNGVACVAVRGNAHPKISGNIIHDSKGCGIFVYENSQGVIEDNEIYGNAFSGVQITEDSNPILKHNKIHDGKSDGIIVYENGQGVIEDNEIYGNASSGVVVREGGNPIIKHNRINKNGYAAIRIYKSGAGTIEDNDLRENKMGAWNISEDSRSLVKLLMNQKR